MKHTINEVHFGDERDYCFNCPYPPEHCDEKKRLCGHALAVNGPKRIRGRPIDIQHYAGVAEPTDKALRFGPSNYGED